MSDPQITATAPLHPETITKAAVAVWLEYSAACIDEHIELSSQAYKVAISRPAYDPELADEFVAPLRGMVERAFLDGFSMGCAYSAGAAATVRVDGNASGNTSPSSPLPRVFGISLNCSTFGDGFGEVVAAMAREHGIEPLGGEWRGRCAIALTVDGVGTFDATALGNAAIDLLGQIATAEPDDGPTDSEATR